MNLQTKKLLHGGDYNPEQWLKYPEVIEQDFKLLKEANVNTITVGMFAWSTLEPKEGEFQFAWLDDIFRRAEEAGMNIILGTPSGARPQWLAETYPEVLRTNANREKMLFGGRHNHCFTSPDYIEKVQTINQKLAERYGQHPNLLMWHLSNEYSGECHCDLCQTAFRQWLQAKYQTLDAINDAYWNTFWSHNYSSWEQIQSPSPRGEMGVHTLNLDWRRFVTDQTIRFYQLEKEAILPYSSHLPFTANFMADTDDLIPFQSLNYEAFAKVVDVLSWDCYPAWHNDWETEVDLAVKVGFINDLYRSLKQQSFLIMESTPSLVNWHKVNKTKRPKFHLLSSIQFLAHGSDSVLYFQIRKSKGSFEKFHGAIIDHDSSPDNRVFQEIKQVGHALGELSDIQQTMPYSKVAILYDWENDWAMHDAQAFSKDNLKYHETLHKHYRYFWDKDISVDVVTPKTLVKDYQLIIVPMLYMMTDELVDYLHDFASKGGKVVFTYLTGLVNESDLVYSGGIHPKLSDMLGLKLQETDTLYPSQSNTVRYKDQSFTAKDFCSVVELTTARALADYTSDFYSGKPAITENQLGQGTVYYLATRLDHDLLTDFYADLISDNALSNNLVQSSTKNVSVQVRNDTTHHYVFVMNFANEAQVIELNQPMFNLVTKEMVGPRIDLTGFEGMVLKAPLTQ